MIKNLIVALGPEGGIGQKGVMPFENREDRGRFVELTTGHALIMGRRTWNSIGYPLPGRTTIVVSQRGPVVVQEEHKDKVHIVTSLKDAILLAEQLGHTEVFFAGGVSIYKEALERDWVDMMYTTVINNSTVNKLRFDTYFPDYGHYFNGRIPDPDRDKWVVREMHRGMATGVHFYNFCRKRTHSEFDARYFRLLEKVLDFGVMRPTRVGPAVSIFDASLRFDMREGFPLLSTKKMAFNAIKTELLWFLKGCKNIKYLNDRNVHIWDKDAYAHFQKLFSRYNAYQDCCDMFGDTLDSEYFPLEHLSFEHFMELVEVQHKLILIEIIDDRRVGDTEYTFGDVGPIYGAQWTNFNNCGINQIDALIKTLRTDPTNRRLVVTAWNPEALPDMALPPCHYAMEFYTEPIPREERVAMYNKIFGDSGTRATSVNMDNCGIPKYYLSVRWIQRSCDMALGVPFDIASYALLLSIICRAVNMLPKEVIGSLGNVHIYREHVATVQKQLERNPYLYAGRAELRLPPQIGDYKKLEPEDIQLDRYLSYPALKYDLFTDVSKQS